MAQALALPFLLGAAGSVAGSIIGGKSAPAPAPAAGPKVMPLADDAAVAAAKKRSLMMQVQRGGRQSTMLSGDSETLGG